MGRDIISLDDLTPNNLGVLKKIIQVTLPTTYPEQWVKDSLNSDQLVKIAYFSELPVGVIRAKSFNTQANTTTYESTQKYAVSTEIPNAVYIEAFGVLKEYRGLGIGKKMLAYLIEETKNRFVHQIVLHVHVGNKEAVEWYLQQGFEKVGELKDYYKEQGLGAPDALILSLAV